MTKLAVALAAALACTISSAGAAAGPWIKGPGEGYVKVSGGAFDSQQIFDVDGTLVDPPFIYSNRAIYTYAEVGLLPELGLAFSLPVLFSTNAVGERLRYNNSGPGDLDVALQGQAYRGDACAASGQVGLRVPLYDGIVPSNNDAALPGIAEDSFIPLLGDGSVDINPGVALGCSLYPIPGWVTLDADLNLRTRGFSSGVRAALGAGIFVWPERIAITARAEVLRRFSDDSERPTKQYISVGGGLIGLIYGGWGVEASASYLPEGAFIARGLNVMVGISYNGRLFPNLFAD